MHRSMLKGKCCNKRGLTAGENRSSYPCIWTTPPESSNTRIIARCDLEWERYFAYAIALRIASARHTRSARIETAY